MAAGLLAHHGYELAAGAGLMFQRELGLPIAAFGWGAIVPTLAELGWRRSAWSDSLRAFAAGSNLAAVTVHYTLWPWKLWPSPRCGVPVLSAAEGLAAGHLPAYNTVLLGWGVASLGAVCETRAGQRRWALIGFLTALPLRRHARGHFTWMRREAEHRPAWWNRALADRGGDDRAHRDEAPWCLPSASSGYATSEVQ